MQQMHDSVDDHNRQWDKRLPIGRTRRATNRSRPVRVAVADLGLDDPRFKEVVGCVSY